jgi:hypothetical protein
LVEEAISPMGRLEVFEAKMVLAGAKLSYSLKKKRNTTVCTLQVVNYRVRRIN